MEGALRCHQIGHVCRDHQIRHLSAEPLLTVTLLSNQLDKTGVCMRSFRIATRERKPLPYTAGLKLAGSVRAMPTVDTCVKFPVLSSVGGNRLCLWELL